MIRKKSRTEYIGETRITNEGYKITCIDVSEKKDSIIIQFEDGHSLTVSTCSFNNGTIKNRNHKSVCGVGFLGYGKYKTGTSRNRPKIEKDCYWFWTSMIKRVHNPNKNIRSDSYQRKKVTIQKEWYNFQNFAEWFYNKSNYREGWQLDKDLISDENIYSDKTCLFVPPRLNTFISIDYKTNTSGFSGVVWNKRENIYVARTWFTDNSNKLKFFFLGRFEDKKDAYISYLKKKIELSNILSEYLIKEYSLDPDDIIIIYLQNKFRKKLDNFIRDDKNEVSYD